MRGDPRAGSGRWRRREARLSASARLGQPCRAVEVRPRRRRRGTRKAGAARRCLWEAALRLRPVPGPGRSGPDGPGAVNRPHEA